MSCTSTRVEVALPPMRVGVLLVLAGLVAAWCTGGRATPPGRTTAGPTTTTPPAPGAAAPSTAGPPAAASDSTGAASAKAAIGPMTLTEYQPQLVLPSGGDCSYPGFAFYDNLLWNLYYSSHEGKTAIYLAKIQVR